MIIAKYLNNYYIGNRLEDSVGIITSNVDKIDTSFTKSNLFWYKEVSLTDKNLTDIYELKLYINYDIDLPEVPKTWKLDVGDDVLKKKNTIKLVFYNGMLPGWRGEDKNISYKYINVNEIKNGSIKKIFYKKDGKACIFPKIYKKNASIAEIVKIEKAILDM